MEENQGVADIVRLIQISQKHTNKSPYGQCFSMAQ